MATIARLAEHAFPPPQAASADPVYADPDFAADFFATIGANMRELVADPGYAALLGALGPGAARQDRLASDGAAERFGRRRAGGDHPASAASCAPSRTTRSCSSSAGARTRLHGLGAAVARHPETFRRAAGESSPRFRRAMDLAEHALKHSDLHVLRAQIAIFDPTTWLDRAAPLALPRTGAAPRWSPSRETSTGWISSARGPGDVPPHPGGPPRAARHLDRRPAHGAARDAAARAAAHPDQPDLAARDRDPGFLAAPRHHPAEPVDSRILRLDIPAALEVLEKIFPANSDPGADLDYAEPRAPRSVSGAYRREHDDIFIPMRRMFGFGARDRHRHNARSRGVWIKWRKVLF